MKRPVCHSLLCLLLGLALALAGAQAAMARLAMAVETAGSTEMVICSDLGAVLVVLDAKGQPMAAKTPRSCANCPDCRLGGLVDLPAVAAAPALALTGRPLDPLQFPFEPWSRPARAARARAPPRGR